MLLCCLHNMDKKLLQRYVEGKTSKKEAESVVEWLDENEANVREFMALHKLYDISLFHKLPAGNEATHTKDKTAKKYKTLAYELLKIAAAFLAFTLISSLFFNKPEKDPERVAYQTLFVPAGQRVELTLPDSTKVWLNAKTRLVYPVSFGEGNRTVTLDGEAYFDVKRNDKQPFIVKTSSMDVTVLGTEFNILAYANLNTAEVSLLKGAININPTGSSGRSKKYTMNVNERVTLDKNKLEISGIHDFDYFKWKEGLLCFNNETVSTIIEKLQLYFDIKINVQKQELLHYRYTGKFRTKDGVEQVLKVLQLEHKFVYKRDQEQNLITIK